MSNKKSFEDLYNMNKIVIVMILTIYLFVLYFIENNIPIFWFCSVCILLGSRDIENKIRLFNMKYICRHEYVLISDYNKLYSLIPIYYFILVQLILDISLHIMGTKINIIDIIINLI